MARLLIALIAFPLGFVFLGAASPRAAEALAAGPLRIILGPQGTGCIAGAVELSASGPGFETIRAGKTAFWGAPSTIEAIRTLGAHAQGSGLPELYIGELSRPRGGPIAGSHVSHQVGLDVDIYLDLTRKPILNVAQRQDLEPPTVVRPDRRGIDPARWRAQHVTLLKLAAGLPAVDRILVNPAIKKELCETVREDRSWLRLIRPWYGHAAHMHIRFRCPADQPECIQAAPPPPGESCDASLQWWFDQLDAPPSPPGPRRPPSPVPAACKAILR